MSKITIALDAMGGDESYRIVLPAALSALKKHQQLHLILVGDEAILNTYLSNQSYPQDRLTVHHASEVVAMDEPPAQALRYKKDSSMRVAINLVKKGTAQACVSAGNTGALMATARFVLKMLPGIGRPAIIKTMPADNALKRVSILDLGANVDCSAEVLEQFAVMGSVFTAAMDGIAQPKVALLNIGSEDIKGNEQVKQAAELLSKNSHINYVGFVEGNGIFKGEVDVIVCDGFVGNVTLKTIEGLAKFIKKLIKDAFYRNALTKLAGLCVSFVMRPLFKSIDPANYNGASLLGLQGIVIKSHGTTTVKGFEKAIEIAVLEAEHDVPNLIRSDLSSIE